MNGELTLEIMGSAERTSLLLLSVHEHLIGSGMDTLARVVWVAYLEASHSAERMGDAVGVDVLVA